MKKDDPRITAFALNEISDPQERAALEAEVARDPSLQAEVESIRAAAQKLNAAFQTEVEQKGRGTEESGEKEASAGTGRAGRKASKSQVLEGLSPAKRRALLAKYTEEAPRLAPRRKRRVPINFNAVAGAMAACLAIVGLLYVNDAYDRIVHSEEESDLIEVDTAEDVRQRKVDELLQKLESDRAEEEAEYEEQVRALQQVRVDRDEGEPAASREDRLSGLVVNNSLSGVGVQTGLGDLAPGPVMNEDLKAEIAAAAAAPQDGSTVAGYLDSSASPPQPAREVAVGRGQTETTRRTSAAISPHEGGGGSENEVYALQPFSLSVSESPGYVASKSLTGTRLRSEVVPRPAPSPITVAPPQTAESTMETYDSVEVAGFKSPRVDPLSTFSIDVDTASYANSRRFMRQGELPPAGAVRIEEWVNYFQYDYSPPAELDPPFAANMEWAEAPWNHQHRLLRIGLKGYEMPWEERPASNLVFLIDVSGSMNQPNKLPLVKEGLKLLVDRLDGRDRVAIVTYAGSERLALPSTTANNRETIRHAIDQLGAGGSTHGSAGIVLAYEVARKAFLEDGNNRVILCSDGDFNVGTTNRSELVRLVEDEARSGIFLSIFGFGMGNYKDAALEEISNRGNGNYGYIDTIAEARKVFVSGSAGTLMTIAKDVKIQVEFNPAKVQAYRLIGYQNRRLAAEDFNDDTKDAGELGAGHTVTALYEIVPVGVSFDSGVPPVDGLKYQVETKPVPNEDTNEVLTLKLRYKKPDEDTSTRMEIPFAPEASPAFADASTDFRWAATVAMAAALLQDGDWFKGLALETVHEHGRAALGQDLAGHRSEFLELLARVKAAYDERG